MKPTLRSRYSRLSVPRSPTRTGTAKRLCLCQSHITTTSVISRCSCGRSMADSALTRIANTQPDSASFTRRFYPSQPGPDTKRYEEDAFYGLFGNLKHHRRKEKKKAPNQSLQRTGGERAGFSKFQSRTAPLRPLTSSVRFLKRKYATSKNYLETFNSKDGNGALGKIPNAPR